MLPLRLRAPFPGFLLVLILGVVQGSALPPGPVPGAWWVFFEDRGPDVSARLAERVAELEASGALERRALRGSVLAGTGDLLPHRDYVATVSDVASPRVSSRFLNALSVRVESVEELRTISALPFVRAVRPVSVSCYSPEPSPLVLWPEPGVMSDGQLGQIGVTDLHERGWSGSGIVVGVLDSGFNLDHVCFDGIDVLEEYDFVDDDSTTHFEQGDPTGTGDHGCGVLSLIGGYEEGMFSGGAPGASFLLARTEDTGDEYEQEEDYWVAGLEWAEENGADVMSSSLGYTDWYTFEDMDGNTAVTTIAADSAAARGLLVVNAMGNDGPGAGTMVAPADGDMVLSIGAVESSGEVAEFSSRGPTYDDRVKPDVMARGYYTIIANYSSGSGYFGRNGTSYATPLVTSVVALMLEQHPAWTPAQIVGILRSTSDRASSPDNDYGWGIVDARSAVGWSSLSGIVRRSDTGAPLTTFPLAVSVDGTEYEVLTNGHGWFLLEPATLGEYQVSSGGGPGEVLEQSGTLDSTGAEIEVFVDMYSGEGEPGSPNVYPNPCVLEGGAESDPGVYVGFDMDRPGSASLTVFSIDGRCLYSEIRTDLPAGAYRAPLPGEAFQWDWRDSSGDRVSSGVYFFLLVTDTETAVLKAALAR